MTVLVVSNQKGGVGKTTTAISLGAALVGTGQRVLIVDLDPQANATSGLGVGKEPPNPIYGVLLKEQPLTDSIASTALDRLDLLASGPDMAGAEVELVPMLAREYRLRQALRGTSAYDTVIIDCPPSLGLLTINALTAGDAVLIPVQCEYYALEGLAQLLKTIAAVHDRLNDRLEVLGIVLTMEDRRNRLSLQVIDEVRRHFPTLVTRARIPRTARLAGRTSIPAVIRGDGSDRLELALVENLQRADLNAIEAARAYKLLMETYELTQEQLAERLGKSRSAVANTLRTLSAPQPLQDAVVDGRIGEGHLRALLPLPLSDALHALATVVSKSLSVRETEALVRKMVHPTRRGRSRARVRGGDPELAHVVAELRTALGTKVEIMRGRRGGRIAIQFYSDDDFERLYELLVRAGKG